MTFAVSPWSPGRRPAGRIVGGVLAGGASRRMGGRPKSLLPWPPSAPTGTLLDAILAKYVSAGVAPAAVVTGAHHQEIALACVSRPDVSVLFNARHAEGQLTSLWRLLDWAEGLPEAPDWLAVTLVDMPAFRPGTLALLCDVARDDAGAALIVRPAVGSRHGHPLLWHRRAWARLRQAPIAAGARPVVHALVAEGLVRDVPVDDPGVLRDIDTPEDYADASYER